MAEKTFTVVVTQVVEVKLDEAKFDRKFMDDFRQGFYPFDTVERHAEHIAQLQARGLIDDFGDQFIEGYGPAKDMGIQVRTKDCDQEVIEKRP